MFEQVYKKITNGTEFRNRFMISKSPINVLFSSVQSLSRVRLFETPRTAACQAFLSVIIS